MSQVYRNVIQAATAAMSADERTPRLMDSLGKLDAFLSGRTFARQPRLDSAMVHLSPAGKVLASSARAQEVLGLIPGEQMSDLPPVVDDIPVPVLLAAEDGTQVEMLAMRCPGQRDILLHEATPIGHARTLSLVTKTFGLIPSERDVLVGLLAGENADEMAERLGRSLGTVRQQTKALLAKLDARSQGQAIARIAALETTGERMQLARYDASAALVRQERIALASGDVTLHRYGVAGGIPVLLAHGALFGSAACADARKTAELLGLDIVMPVRPGYGTTRWRGPEHTLDDTLSIYRDVLAHLGWERALLLAHDVGTVFACTFAAKHPHLVAGLVSGPTTPPMTSWSQTSDMPRKHRVNAWAAQQMPQLMDRIVRFGVTHIQRKGIDVTPDLVFADSAFDREAFGDPTRANMLAESFAMAAAQDAAGFRHDMVLTNRDWSDTLIHVTAPACLFHGDESGTVSGAAVVTMADHMPKARAVRVPAAGHTLPLTQAARLHRSLYALAIRQNLAEGWI